MTWNKFRPSRRAFLGGLGTVVTLPFLESLTSPARAQATPAPVRLVWWALPNGIVMDQYRPSGEGPLPAQLPRILAPLASRRADLLVLSGLANAAASVPVAGDHARGTGSFLTCETVEHSASEIRNGISADQVAANAIGSATAFKSLELGTTGGSGVGDCDSGYSCAYAQNISWRDETTPNPKLVDPALVFDRLFAGFDQTLTEAEVDRRRRWRTSVLDTVLDEANVLSPRLSRSDRVKLDEFMTGVRELELRLGQDLGGECVPGQRPELGLDYPSTARAMSDLTVLALQCDLTRIVTFMMENAGSYRSFDFIGVTGSHHEISHHQGDASKIEDLAQIDVWEMGELAYLLDRLKATTDVDGTDLLTNTLVCCSSEISDGDWHNHDDLPVVLAGQGGGYVTDTGRHKVFADDEPIANLYLAMLEAAGVSAGTFGMDGTRPLDLS